MPNTYVIGDIHGADRALKQVLERSGFNYQNDTLIQLGDIADGWPEVPQCVDELLKMENLIALRGNHDVWLDEWLRFGMHSMGWLEQGGKASKNAYLETGKFDNEDHRRFFRNQRDYFIDDQNRLFVHAGIDLALPMNEQDHKTFMWDRQMIRTVYEAWKANETPPKDVNGFKEIFIGHSNTVDHFTDLKPVNMFNIWNLDQGAHHFGKLTMMNVETKEYVQSDPVQELYPEIQLPKRLKRRPR